MSSTHIPVNLGKYDSTWALYSIRFSIRSVSQSFCCDSVVMNQTSIHENVDLIPGSLSGLNNPA